MPPLGLLLHRIDFSSLFYVLDTAKGQPVSLADAKQKGVPVIAYGAFINDIVNFVIIAFCIFVMVKLINRIQGEEAATRKKCQYCLTKIPIKATRCAACTSELEAE